MFKKVNVVKMPIQFAEKQFTCKEWEDEVDQKGYLVKHQY